MLEVRNISFAYEDQEVLQNISFQLPKGAHLALMGASGSGKSTLLKAIYGQLRLKSGQIKWEGKELLGPDYHLIPGEKYMKIVAQDSDLMPYTTVAENIAQNLSPHDIENHEARITELLEVMGMHHLKHQKVKNLSGGQRQRVAIAKALALKPDILLLDEPFSNIDPFQKNNLRAQLFDFVSQQGITVINATHDIQDVLPFSWMTLILAEGKIETFGPTKQLYQFPKNEYVGSFFNYVNLVNIQSIVNDLEEKHLVICYPDELGITSNGPWKASVIQSLFMGGHYLIKMKNDTNHILWCYHTKAIIPKTKVSLKPATKTLENLFLERYEKGHSA